MDLTERVFADAATVFAKFPVYWAEHGRDFFDNARGYTAGRVFLMLARLAQEQAGWMPASQWHGSGQWPGSATTKASLAGD